MKVEEVQPMPNDDNDVVHKSGEETIDGVKINKQRVIFKQTENTPAIHVYAADDIKDTKRDYPIDSITVRSENSAVNDKRLSILRCVDKNLEGNRISSLCTVLPSNTNMCSIGVGYLDIEGSNPVAFAYAPETPLYEADGTTLRTFGTDILTRNWIPKDTRIVHTTGNETITGEKNIQWIKSQGQFVTYASNIDITSPPTSGTVFHTDLEVRDKNNQTMLDIYNGLGSSGATEFNFRVYSADKTVNNVLSIRVTSSKKRVVYFASDTLYPGSNGSCNLGDAGNKWGQIYSTSSTISTSDARLKTTPEAIPDNVLDAWGDVNFVQFQMLDSVQSKGMDKARFHSGIVAQNIADSFKSSGLDASRYGLFCYDEWETIPEEKDEEGNIVQQSQEAGNLYSLRYEEALCMEAAYQRRRASRAEARITELEQRLNSLEEKLVGKD